MKPVFCPGVLEKQRRIDELEEAGLQRADKG